MKPTERAYLAGILDGEGCLGVGKRLKYITPTVQISNTGMALLSWVQMHFGGSIYAYKPRGDNRRQCYLYSCAGQKALKIIKAARPYLILKSGQADLLLSMK